MNIKSPIVCICETYDSPVLGIFRNFGYKHSVLKNSEATILGLMTEDDRWDRFKEDYYLVYRGRRPSIKKIKTFYLIENINY